MYDLPALPTTDGIILRSMHLKCSDNVNPPAIITREAILTSASLLSVALKFRKLICDKTEKHPKIIQIILAYVTIG